LGLLVRVIKLDSIDAFHVKYSIKYRDDEGDLVTIESQGEFMEAVLISKSGLLRLEIIEKQISTPTSEQPQHSCPFFNRKTCHWKSWRQIHRESTPTSEQPQHPCSFFNRQTTNGKSWGQLHREALKLFDSQNLSDLELARTLLLQQYEMTPNHPITLYNLACIESRLQNIPAALNYLEQSLQKGYKNLDHINTDTDLENLRNHEAFKELISRYQSNTTPQKCCRSRSHLWYLLEKQIHILFESKSTNDLELARQLLLKQLEIEENFHTYYNLACVQSLLKNQQSALEYLDKAISLGWKDGDHMDKDSDFDFIRESEGYKKIRDQLRSKDDAELYKDQLNKLAGMGFTDREKNLMILKQTEGNLETAILLLLNGSI